MATWQIRAFRSLMQTQEMFITVPLSCLCSISTSIMADKNLFGGIIESNALGEQAINAALAIGVTNPAHRSIRFPEVFLNWGLANWANTQAQNKQLGYSHLRNRRVNATVPHILNYPNHANNIPIEPWSPYYTVLKNLPETLDLSVIRH